MKRFFLFVTALTALGFGSEAPADSLKIVATTSDLAAIAKAVAGDKA